MSSVPEKALFQLKKSRHLKEQSGNLLVIDVHSLLKTDKSNTSTDPPSPIGDNIHVYEQVQYLDTQLHAHITNENYDSALDIARTMQIYTPEFYYGYQRVAQVYLIRNEFGKAYYAYCQGFKNVSTQDGLDLLRAAVEDTLFIFDQAVNEYVQMYQFQKAQHIATMMIRLHPTSTVGYLRSGRLYEMQGNTKRSLEVYNQGIACVSANDKGIIVEHANKLQQQSERMRRRDFIMQAPPEIVPSILRNLATCDLMECMDVSKSWKERVQHCNEAWRVVTVDSYDRSIEMATVHEIKPFVQKIKFTGYYDADELHIINDLLTAITDGDFVNLVDIDLDLSGGPGIDLSYYYEIVERVKLTGLSITTFIENGRLTPLRQFLELSPFLKYLEYDTNSLGFFAPYEVRRPLEPSMVTHLDLRHFFVTSHQEDALPKILPGFPLLVQLHIDDCGPHDLRVITEHCVNLRWLSIGNNYQCETVPSHTIQENMPLGLQYLNIDITEISANDVTEIITENYSTLKALRLKHTYRNNTSTEVGTVDEKLDLPTSDYTSSPESSKLCISYDRPMEQIYDCITSEDAALIRCRSTDNSIFQTFKESPNLSQIRLAVKCENLTHIGLSRLFNGLMSREYVPRLRSMEFWDISVLNIEMLVTLANIESLNSLCITNCKSITGDALELFATKVSRGNQIIVLSIDRLNGVTDQTILNLVYALPQIQLLGLSSLEQITDDGLHSIADASKVTNLSVLHIKDCHLISSSAISDARKLLNVKDSLYLVEHIK